MKPLCRLRGGAAPLSREGRSEAFAGSVELHRNAQEGGGGQVGEREAPSPAALKASGPCADTDREIETATVFNHSHWAYDARIILWDIKPATRALAQAASLTSHKGVIFTC